MYTLPGRNYKEADLKRISEQALKEADVSLIEDAWEVSSAKCLRIANGAENARLQRKSLFTNTGY